MLVVCHDVRQFTVLSTSTTQEPQKPVRVKFTSPIVSSYILTSTNHPTPKCVHHSTRSRSSLRGALPKRVRPIPLMTTSSCTPSTLSSRPLCPPRLPPRPNRAAGSWTPRLRGKPQRQQQPASRLCHEAEIPWFPLAMINSPTPSPFGRIPQSNNTWISLSCLCNASRPWLLHWYTASSSNITPYIPSSSYAPSARPYHDLLAQ